MSSTLNVTLAGGDPSAIRSPLLCIALPAGSTLPSALAALNDTLGSAIATALESRDFRGARDEILYLSGAANAGPRRIALIGLGVAGSNTVAVRRAASVSARQAGKLGVGEVAFWTDNFTPELIESAAIGLHLGAWQYRETKTLPPEAEQKAPVTVASVVAAASAAHTRAVDNGNAIGAGYTLARSVAMLPGNLCTPDYLADTAEALATRHHMRFTSLDRAAMEAEKMGAFLAVAQGTPQEPRLVAMEYKGGKVDEAPIVLIGKGLCFDTGGISIKPAAGMEWMKFDMCGAAGVIGAMEAVARLKLPLNVVGVFGATTNMPSGTSMKPGDVVQAQSGKYIEIVNTDAEGRLVLADLLSYVRRFKPAAVIDAATLTGACVVALGNTATGVFGSDQRLVDEVLRASERAGERGWQLPIWDEYKELIKSDVADIKNAGARNAGAITAALFLKEFAEGYPWVHLDVAGTAYSETDLVWAPKGPTGTPVGIFVELLRSRATS